jgi:hypothetical protein
MTPAPMWPEWWNWELPFTAHAELRVEQRGVTEVDVRAILEMGMSQALSRDGS